MFFWKKNQSSDIKISIAITTYNRSDMVLQSVQHIIEDERVSEIIVCDDASNRDTYEKMVRSLCEASSKFRIIRNEKNLGPFHNKISAVSICNNVWAILLDSDNSIRKDYIDCIYSIKQWDTDTIYCPCFARPHFDMRYFSRRSLTIKDVRRELNGGRKKLTQLLLNTGNYFVPVKNYGARLRPFSNLQVAVADVITANYIWLDHGGLLSIVKKLEYEHLVHEGSNFKTRESEGKILVQKLCQYIVRGSSSACLVDILED